MSSNKLLKPEEIKKLQEELKMYCPSPQYISNSYGNSTALSLADMERLTKDMCNKLQIPVPYSYSSSSYGKVSPEVIDTTFNQVINSINMLSSSLSMSLNNINKRLSDIENRQEILIKEMAGIEE